VLKKKLKIHGNRPGEINQIMKIMYNVLYPFFFRGIAINPEENQVREIRLKLNAV